MKLRMAYTIMPLLALMALTRVHHFGDQWSLPDASLAVFFLAGLLMNSRLLFVALVVEAVLLDYIAIVYGGVSGFCISPAYAFLIPSYAALWFAGRYAAPYLLADLLPMLWKQISSIVVGASIAFFISNVSFYAFSGRYDAMPLADYLASVTAYYSPYVLSGVVYSLIGIASIKLATYLRDLSVSAGKLN